MNTLPSRRAARGFTLLEMLVVIGIIALLSALVIPAFNQIGGGQNLTAAADLVAGRMDLARHLALSENERVELRFIRSGGPDAPLDALQTFRVSSGEPVDGLMRLPAGMEVVDKLEYSTLVSAENPLEGNTSAGGQSALPYKAILFRGDGSTHLSPDPPAAGSNAWTISLAQSSEIQAADGALPVNFATVMIDPITGRATIYRP